MFKAAAHIVLAVSILISSMGFTMFERLCNVAGKDITLTADHGACCSGHEHKMKEQAKVKGSCCKLPVKQAPVSVRSSKCCEFNAIFLQAHAGAPTVEWKAPVLNADWMTVHPVVILQELVSLVPHTPSHEADLTSDPPNGRAIRVLCQSFLC